MQNLYLDSLHIENILLHFHFQTFFNILTSFGADDYIY